MLRLALGLLASTILGNREVVIPTFFDWTPDFTITSNGTTNYDPLADKPSGIERWVSETGSDSNDGLTEGTAYRSLSAAEADNPNIINIKSGTYYDGNGGFGGFTGTDPTVSTAFVAVDGPGTVTVFRGRDGTDFAWTPETSPNQDVYATSRNNINSILDRTNTRSGEYLLDGVTEVPIPLVERATIEDCQANPGSWFEDSGTLYVHTHDSRTPEADVLITLGTDNFEFRNDITAYLEGIEVWGRHPIKSIYAANNSAKLILNNVAARFNGDTAGVSSGVYVDGTDTVRVINSVATDNPGDGFGYVWNDNSITDRPEILEENCTALRNGWNGSGDNDNGSSAHDECIIIRARGVYSENYGPNVADVEGAQSLNVRVTASNSNGMSGSGPSNFLAGTSVAGISAKMFLLNCISTGSTYDRYKSGGGVIIDMGGFSGDAVDVGTLLPYPLDTAADLLTDAVFELDVTDENSYAGTGSAYNNLIEEPSVGGEQEDYNFTKNGWVFNGTAGTPQAYFEQTVSGGSGQYFEITSGNTPFINSLHKTTGGNAWTYLSVVRDPSTSGQLRFFSTTGGAHGILLQGQSNSHLNLLHVPGFNGPAGTQDVSNAAYGLVGVSFDPGSGDWEFRIDSQTKETGSFTPSTTTTDADQNMLIGAFTTTNGTQATTRMKWSLMVNGAISDADYSLVQAYAEYKDLYAA